MKNKKYIILLIISIFSLNIFAAQVDDAEINYDSLDINSNNFNINSNNRDNNLNNRNNNIANGFEPPENLSILNTNEDNFAPFFNSKRNELIFNSIYNDYSTYFVSKIDTSFNFSVPKVLFSHLNQARQNRSYFTLIDDNEALVCAFNLTERGSFLNIHKSVFKRNAWSSPSPIPEFSDSCFIAHPTVSPNGEILVFSTNKNEANRSVDLWMATKQADNSWDMFVPIDELNSIGNEITPFLASDSLLIFASDGFEGAGGVDL
jgi:hypothetical protein